MNLFTRSSGTNAFAGLLCLLLTIGCGTPAIQIPQIDSVLNTQPIFLPVANSRGQREDTSCRWVFARGKQRYTPEGGTLKPNPIAVLYADASANSPVIGKYYLTGWPDGIHTWDIAYLDLTSTDTPSNVHIVGGTTAAAKTLLPAKDNNQSWMGMPARSENDPAINAAYSIFTYLGAPPTRGSEASPQELEAPYSAWHLLCNEFVFDNSDALKDFTDSAPYGRTHR